MPPPRPPGPLRAWGPAPAAAGHSAPRGSPWPGNRSAPGASHPHSHPQPWGALHTGAPGPSSFPSRRSPGCSPAPPLGPSLTSPGARGPQRSRRPQSSRSAISAPRPQRQQQLWRHKRLKTRSTAEAKLARRRAERRREGAVCSPEAGRSRGARIRCVGRSPRAGRGSLEPGLKNRGLRTM